MIEQIKSLHSCWNKTTGQEVHFQATERIWYDLARLDFTADDLLAVLKHVMAYNRSHADCPMKIQVLKLCGDVENFASICADAKARERSRPPKPTPREIVLEDFRGFKPDQSGNVRNMGEVFEAMRRAVS